ncbi:MAG: tyrosine-type recombinase/integrase [Thermoanaerobaculales bacterium]|jgi:integrase/recombinase XerD|nr:tyrosine-type recombinase/integrase [Thermoanaerobaculales bacterium]
MKNDRGSQAVDRRTLRARRIEDLVPTHPGAPGRLALDYLHHLAARGCSPHTIRSRRAHLRLFLLWLAEIGCTSADGVSPSILDDYRLAVRSRGRVSGGRLSPQTERDRLANVLRFFRWLVRSGRLTTDPTIGVSLPRCHRRLPGAVLTAPEAQRVMTQPDLASPLGLRDRAILETLYATGLRRQELVDLELASVDVSRGVLVVRLGKG